MDAITLNDVLPRAFAASGAAGSDVCNREVAFGRGRFYLVEAQSGAGKSSLCAYLMGYRDDYSGSICFDGRDVRRLGIAEWSAVRRGQLSCLFQELRLFPELTAWENVELKNGLTHRQGRKKVEAWFERLGIADKLDVPVARLSFGQQQRVAAIRSLAQPFSFLLADEPVSHLDDANAAALAGIVAEEAASQGAGVVVTSVGRRLPLDFDLVLRL